MMIVSITSPLFPHLDHLFGNLFPIVSPSNTCKEINEHGGKIEFDSIFGSSIIPREGVMVTN